MSIERKPNCPDCNRPLDCSVGMDARTGVNYWYCRYCNCYQPTGWGAYHNYPALDDDARKLRRLRRALAWERVKLQRREWQSAAAAKRLNASRIFNVATKTVAWERGA